MLKCILPLFAIKSCKPKSLISRVRSPPPRRTKQQQQQKNIDSSKQNFSQEPIYDTTASCESTVIEEELKQCEILQKEDNSIYTEEYCKCVMITGGSGFIGSPIAEALLREGRKVVVFDSFDSETSNCSEKLEHAQMLQSTAEEFSSIGAYVTIVHGDICDQDKIVRTIMVYGVTACIHLGGMVDNNRCSVVKQDDPRECIDINARGTATLLDALGKCDVKMIVQASTDDSTTARRPTTRPHGASMVGADAMAHCYCRIHEINVTLLRVCATVYGPRGRPNTTIPCSLIEKIVKNKPIRKLDVDADTTARTWIYISDIVSAFLAALKNPQSGYAEFYAGALSSNTLDELIECAESVTGKAATIEHCPILPDDAHNTEQHASCESINNAIGWEPNVNIMEGMGRTYEDYLARMEGSASTQEENSNGKTSSESIPMQEEHRNRNTRSESISMQEERNQRNASSENTPMQEERSHRNMRFENTPIQEEKSDGDSQPWLKKNQIHTNKDIKKLNRFAAPVA